MKRDLDRPCDCRGCQQRLLLRCRALLRQLESSSEEGCPVCFLSRRLHKENGVYRYQQPHLEACEIGALLQELRTLSPEAGLGRPAAEPGGR